MVTPMTQKQMEEWRLFRQRMSIAESREIGALVDLLPPGEDERIKLWLYRGFRVGLLTWDEYISLSSILTA